jgi:sulfate adenylyltransferase
MPLPRPHGGPLVDRFVSPAGAAALAERAAALPALTLDGDQLDDVELVACGAASPVAGFLGREEHRSVLDRWRLASGALWPWPLTLAVPPPVLDRITAGSEVALRDPRGRVRAVLAVSDVFLRDPREEAALLVGTDNPAHPGAAALLARPAGALGGELVALALPDDRPLAARRLSPLALRSLFEARGLRRVAALHPSGLPNRAQTYLAKLALDLADALLVHPSTGSGPETIAAWDEVARELPADRVMVAALPAPERHGGAREVLLDALVRRNYGVSQLFVVRRGDQLRPVDGLPADIDPAEVGISIVPFSAELSLPGGDGLTAVA